MSFAAMEEQIVREILQELENSTLVLPSLPDVVLKVRQEIEDEDVTSRRLRPLAKRWRPWRS